MTRSAAVTGATGFLGSRLCDRLAAEGWDVRALSRPTSDRSGIDHQGDLEWVVGDVFDRQALGDLVDGADVVFHLAGIGLWSADPATVEQVNREGTRNVLEVCRDSDVGRVVFTSTAGTLRATDGDLADETDVAEPIGAYQRSKATAERLVDAYAEADGDAVTVHPTSIFGPGDEGFTMQLLAMGLEPTMPATLPGGASIVGVDDVVAGLLAAADHGTCGEHYLLGGENLTYDEAAARIADYVGGTAAPIQVPAAAIRAAGPVAEGVSAVTGQQVFPFTRGMADLATKRLFYTSRKAHEELGYEYQPLEAHVPDALEWYRSQ
ncbi:NAD-dependent epimerase/dehydratase family protein [Natrarchaeobaculum aegyptiacum]|uniref:Epimerase n=1 Tax=Natrarchaeobaculum aegyptiacum TaxID=745377 RepID=A0A2Z2HX18_9EURY|nr:NAD-dependent epimerase/dehydratase family protein [Natrarchaeobaculum aegyptiacum]ARS90177.1 epimerase [Natrarchaeobaculum aegyptiacum]